jgi:hypothetical protein
VVVDDFGDFRFLHAVDGLGVFVVINEREPDARRIDEVGFGDDADHFASDRVHHREQILIAGREAFAHAGNRRGRADGFECFGHDVAHGA